MAIKEGLKDIQNETHIPLLVESDSRLAIQLPKGDDVDLTEVCDYIRQIHELDALWAKITYQHTGRNKNQAADDIAKRAAAIGVSGVDFNYPILHGLRRLWMKSV